ncbi:MAG: hypothetical protein M3Z65_05585 [Chloroflexota bacterium]|nr:hypothetical protein [Chloroflexota bacterium]
MRSLRAILLAIVATVALLGVFGSVASADPGPQTAADCTPQPAMLDSDPGDPGIPD